MQRRPLACKPATSACDPSFSSSSKCESPYPVKNFLCTKTRQSDPQSNQNWVQWQHVQQPFCILHHTLQADSMVLQKCVPAQHNKFRTGAGEGCRVQQAWSHIRGGATALLRRLVEARFPRKLAQE